MIITLTLNPSLDRTVDDLQYLQALTATVFVELNFVFDPAGGQLVAIEMTAAADSDPCDIRFSDYRDLGGRQVPYKLEVHHGDEPFGQIQWNQIELPPPAEEKKP